MARLSSFCLSVNHRKHLLSPTLSLVFNRFIRDYHLCLFTSNTPLQWMHKKMKAQKSGMLLFEHHDTMSSSLDKVYILQLIQEYVFWEKRTLRKHRNHFSSSRFVSAQKNSCLFLAHCVQEKLAFSSVTFPPSTNFSLFRQLNLQSFSRAASNRYLGML